jgi:pentatricopeptide repeat protein
VENGHAIQLVTTLKEMKELGLRPDILTYNSAMELFGKRKMEDEAWALVDDMKALGISPDIETFKFLLQVHLINSILLDVPKVLIPLHRLFVTLLTKRPGPCLK